VTTVETTKILGRPSMPLPVALPAFGAPVFDVPVSHVSGPECVDGWRREPLYAADLFRTQGLSVSDAGSAAAALIAGPAQQQDQSSNKASNGMVRATRGRMTGGIPPRGRPD
jgi:hypothetical protein